MPTLYYATHSRASRVISQLIMMGKLEDVTVVTVGVPRQDGSGASDPKNPHLEKKVPYLVTEAGDKIRETNAIMTYLDELYGYPFGIAPGKPGRGTFLSWMAYYGGIVEPVMINSFAGDVPMMSKNFGTLKDMATQIQAGLDGKPYLLGDTVTIADIIMASPFAWISDLTPDVPEIKAWIARVAEAQDPVALEAFESKAKAKFELGA